MNVIQNADVNKLANIIRRIANEQEQGLWEFRFKGKPEGSPAATRYPNLLAEVVVSGYSPESVADAANITYPVFAAVIEDGEELTPGELRGIQKLIASRECARCYDALSMDYLASPALSFVCPHSNKGKFLRWKFERMKANAASSAVLTVREKLHAKSIGELLHDGDRFYYAGYRQTMNELARVVFLTDSFRRIAEAIERDRKRERERPARRERRFEREVTV